MKTEVLRDMSFRIIGYVKTDEKGNKTIQDPSFRTQGFYSSALRVTQDSSFRNLFPGDQSRILLKGP